MFKEAQKKITHHKLTAGGAALLLLTLILFGDVLFFSPQMVLSRLGEDLSSQFVPWRYFGFSQLKQGVLPLWNPHIYSGAPYVGGFQSAMFYPFNLLYVIMPLASAINYSIALHVFLLGFFMYLWVLYKGVHPAAALLAGMLGMFCGAFFPHIYPGHLSNLSVMPWVPLLFFSIDRYSYKPALGPILVGVLSVTMQILAGHPQYVFYAGVAAVLYLILDLFFTQHKFKTVLGFIVIYFSAALVSAVQLFTGLAAAAESARSSVPYDFAAIFSFPYGNLLTLITPGFFGNVEELPYWGLNLYWEMSLFISITGLILAVYGAIHAEKKIRLTSLALFSVLLVFAFGKYTPLFNLLYYMVPGFNKFRGISKFIFPASLFLILLAAAGFHALLQRAAATAENAEWRQEKPNNGTVRSPKARQYFPFAVFPFAGGLLLLCLGGLLFLIGNEVYQSVIRFILDTGDSYFPGQFGNETFLQQARASTGYQLLWAGGVSLAVSLLLFLGKRWRELLFLLPVLALTELLIFALPLRPAFNIGEVERPELKQALAAVPGDYRILYGGEIDAAMTLGTSDVWGDDPMVLKRYAEFMAYTQGIDPDTAVQDLQRINRYHPLYKMLRLRFAIPEQARTSTEWIEFPGTMKRLNLIYNFSVLKDRDSILSSLSNPVFDPAQSVILETSPNVIPEATAAEKSRVDVVDSSANHLTIEADLSSPAILLVTDLYASGWQAKALPGSVQSDYQVLPADYILKAIPLKAGRHQFRLFYQPQAFIIGAWVSGLSLLCLIGGSLLHYILLARKRALRDTL